MHTIEFKVDVSDRMIKHPAECINFNNKHIKLTAYIDKKLRTLQPSQLTDERHGTNWRNFIMTMLTTLRQDDDLILQKNMEIA